jgi:hypothetical protein
MKNLSLLFIVFLFLHLTTFAQWTQKADIPTARSFLSSCTLDSLIYVIGGTESTNPYGPSVGTMEVYDPILDSWDTTKAPMPTSREQLGSCAVNGKIYTIGGAPNHGGSPLGTVEEYDPSTDMWSTKTPMPTPRYGCAYGVIDNKIYVAGGTVDNNFTASNKLEIYDPETDTWDITKAPMLIAMYQPQGAVINDKFYVIGGLLGTPPYTGQKTVQMYDPTIDDWSLVAYLNYGRVGHTTNGVAGNIYAIGGDTQPPPVLRVEEYDPNNPDTWTPIALAPFVKIVHTASVFENKIYLISGSTTSLMAGFTPDSTVYSFAPPPAAPILIEPLNNAILSSDTVQFVWHKSYAEVEKYWLEIDITDQFTTSFVDSVITGTTYLYSNLQDGIQYWWRVRAFNSLGWGEFSEVRTFDVIITSVEEDNQLPVEFSLDQNYPNPFNPATTIKYYIPELSFVTLKVHDVLGSEVAILVNEEKAVGYYEIEFNASSLASGIYFYRLQAGDPSTGSGQGFVETKKMLLLR